MLTYRYRFKSLIQKRKNLSNLDLNIDSNIFNNEQIDQIILGYKKGLTLEKINLYTDPKFSPLQMEEIRLGVEELEVEQVSLYAKPEFDPDRMYIFREYAETKLDLEQILILINSELDIDVIKEIVNHAADGTKIELLLKDIRSKFPEEKINSLISILY